MTPITGLHGSLTVCRTLETLGVRHVFGVPGTQNTAFYEALRQIGLSAVVPMHELSAAFMAGAYYRASGIPGVLTTIPGPGLAYALAGLAEARLDSAAVLYLINGPRTDTKIGYSLQALDQRACWPRHEGYSRCHRTKPHRRGRTRSLAARDVGRTGPCRIGTRGGDSGTFGQR